jgi:hypothetical protein
LLKTNDFFAREKTRKKGGPKNEGVSTEVFENKWQKMGVAGFLQM